MFPPPIGYSSKAFLFVPLPPIGYSSKVSSYFLGTYFLISSLAAVGFFLGGTLVATGSGAFSFFSGLSYLLGLTFYADSFTFCSFYGFKSDKNFVIAASPSLPFIIPNADNAASRTSLYGSSVALFNDDKISPEILYRTSIYVSYAAFSIKLHTFFLTDGALSCRPAINSGSKNSRLVHYKNDFSTSFVSSIT